MLAVRLVVWSAGMLAGLLAEWRGGFHDMKLCLHISCPFDEIGTINIDNLDQIHRKQY